MTGGGDGARCFVTGQHGHQGGPAVSGTCGRPGPAGHCSTDTRPPPPPASPRAPTPGAPPPEVSDPSPQRRPVSPWQHRAPGGLALPGGARTPGRIRPLLTHTRGAHAPGLEPQARGGLSCCGGGDAASVRTVRPSPAAEAAARGPMLPARGVPGAPGPYAPPPQRPAPLVGVRAPEPLPALLGGDSAPWWPRGRGCREPGRDWGRLERDGARRPERGEPPSPSLGPTLWAEAGPAVCAEGGTSPGRLSVVGKAARLLGLKAEGPGEGTSPPIKPRIIAGPARPPVRSHPPIRFPSCLEILPWLRRTNE
ncbi:collagen alpha-1(III) chain-like [Canis lupus familiaris]|uniref:collagen alpha-1(III) chain-like n=1 Tax=Canis lupus familiaris TaxID=9615 RepID=UPI0003ADEEBC|nr:collagen alpha-1(III) chain-like [Canis lupus familiaris]|eukprot:XP_005636713.1 collagen alpha-1(III) chain-like [Canis lupus familiaris]